MASARCTRSSTGDRRDMSDNTVTHDSKGRFARRHGQCPHGNPTPLHAAWQSMIKRCTNPKRSDYRLYGGRGIKVCQRWRESFEAFAADMGEKPSLKHSLDRIDSNRDYEPGNCRWATAREQQRNKRTSRPVIRSDGTWFPTVADAAEAVDGEGSGVRQVCVGRGKTYRGYSWKFADRSEP